MKSLEGLAEFEFKEGITYPPIVHHSVRYGYQYRVIAEEYERSSDKEFLQLHFCLGSPSDILLWLGNIVISGVTWDAFKYLVNKCLSRIKTHKYKIDKQAKQILKNEVELHKFYTYIWEFNKGSMQISKGVKRYITEEIIADFMAKDPEFSSITKQRIPTLNETEKCVSAAIVFAQEILRQNKDESKDLS